jgi:MFS family permease
VALDRTARPSLSVSEHRGQLRRALIASTIGTTIEWYDFLLYSTVTGLVFAKLFFPDSDPLIGTLQAYVIFYIGFIARPVGAAIFGHYGDRIGRKASLIATLVITGLATVAVGLVPTYQQIGIWAALIMIVLRFIQGVGVGGEWGGPAPFVTTALLAAYASGYMVALYILACCVISIVCAMLLQDHTNKDLAVAHQGI